MPELNSLPPELEEAVEQLAERVHEAWIENRRADGWRFAEQRDDRRRETPLLVPYRNLDETDRELDRVSVRASLQGLRELGYRIELDATPRPTAARDALLAEVDRLIARGQPLPAYDVTKRWLREHPGDRQWLLANARALRRCGALLRARRVLEEIAGDADADGERRGLLAAVHKEVFLRSYRAGRTHALDDLRRAQELYQSVFDESSGAQCWHGINAATLAFLLGAEDRARALAERVLLGCDRAEPSAADYWLLATRAEATLLLGRFAEAAEEYRAAARIASDRVGDVASTRQNAMLLLDALDAADVDRGPIEAALRPPAIVIFAGPPLGPDSVIGSSLPPELEDRLQRDLDERLASLDAGFGFSGAAPGTDTLFLEALARRAGSVLSVVLPWPREQYLETHVRPCGDPWARRFAALLGGGLQEARVQHVVSATLGVGIDAALYERFAQQLLFGLARLQAKSLAAAVVPLVVRSSSLATPVDALVERWAEQGVTPGTEHVIDLAPLLRRRPLFARGVAGASRAGAVGSPAAFRVMAILFADVEDYSKIAEHKLPAFVEYFVGGIAGRLGVRPYRPVNVRRVGDGLLMVFAGVLDAALYALDLVEWAAAHSEPATDGETYWSRVGLPREMRMRVALHAGPVFECVDPLTGAVSFEGAHINYAARIEPVTPGNQVYASEAFAALAASWPAPCTEFVCEYVGRTSLAKRFGDYPLYHVRRS
jgi:tetratricopeptide (TPR) repeat protein